MKKTLNSEELKRLQQIETDMLVKTAEVCEKLGIKYYLCAGTLLGAVRHKGFIPWDDDIDIVMMRPDYERFIREAQKFMPDNYFVQSYLTEKNLPIGFSKIRNSNTAFMETSLRNHRINKGVFIDIFPLDFYPDDDAKAKKVLKKKKLYDLCSRKDFYQELPFSKRIKVLALRMLTFYMPHKKAIVKREELAKQTVLGKRVACYCESCKPMPIEWFGEGKLVDFEGHKFVAPLESEKYLTSLYGDYMQLPPEEKRIAHHYIDVFDLDKSYKEYEK